MMLRIEGWAGKVVGSLRYISGRRVDSIGMETQVQDTKWFVISFV
jgi:hypothetical protein